MNNITIDTTGLNWGKINDLIDQLESVGFQASISAGSLRVLANSADEVRQKIPSLKNRVLDSGQKPFSEKFSDLMGK